MGSLAHTQLHSIEHLILIGNTLQPRQIYEHPREPDLTQEHGCDQPYSKFCGDAARQAESPKESYQL